MVTVQTLDTTMEDIVIICLPHRVLKQFEETQIGLGTYPPTVWYERTKHPLFCCSCRTCCPLAEGSFKAQQISPQTKLQFLCKRMGCHHWAVCGFIVLFFSPLPYSIFTSLLYLSSLHFFSSVYFQKPVFSFWETFTTIHSKAKYLTLYSATFH